MVKPSPAPPSAERNDRRVLRRAPFAKFAADFIDTVTSPSAYFILAVMVPV